MTIEEARKIIDEDDAQVFDNLNDLRRSFIAFDILFEEEWREWHPEEGTK